MSAAVAVDEYLWNGITYDPNEPDVIGYIIIPDLPPVAGTEVACPRCGQMLDVICGEALVVPNRHYRDALCPIDGDMLNGVIARAQRAAVSS